ncbi:MAG: hypothetical protein U0271_28680 [Polyangiaceae bacterium]
MKLKVIHIDLELNRTQKTAIAMVLACVAVGGAASLANATVKHQFTSGQTLKAIDLNDNFADLDKRLVALESPTSIAVEGYTSFDASIGAYVHVPYDTIQHDALGEFDAAAGTFTPQQAGDYEICAALSGNFPSGTPAYEIDLYVDDVRNKPFVYGHSTGLGGATRVLGTGCNIFALDAGVTVDFRVHQEATATASFQADGYWDTLRIRRL